MLKISKYKAPLRNLTRSIKCFDTARLTEPLPREKKRKLRTLSFLVKVAGTTPAYKASLAPDRAAVLWTISDGLKL